MSQPFAASARSTSVPAGPVGKSAVKSSWHSRSLRLFSVWSDIPGSLERRAPHAGRLNGLKEGPLLGALAFFDWVFDDVLDGAVDVFNRVEVDFPSALRPHCRNPARSRLNRLKRMQATVDETARGGEFQVAHDVLSVALVTCDHRVNVFGKNRKRVEFVALLLRHVTKGFGDDEGLSSGDFDRGKLKGALRTEAKIAVVFVAGEIAALGSFGRGTEAEELPRADEIGPGSTRIVGEPEPIHRDDDVGGEDHVIPPFASVLNRRSQESP